jgi:RHS repeat-associated protein
VFTYDDDGNMLSDGTRTFSWDAENRLVKVITGTDVREWVYNGVGLRVARKLNGAVSKQWVWDGTTLREQRDAANIITRRYYGQGVVQGATLPAAATDKLCYTRDHLGSIRELVDGTGALRARYEYDPYGDRTKLSGTADADIGYTGHYQDVSGSLVAAPFRCYDPKLGRWLSPDPIGEEGGINLYGYVGNGPTTLIDPLGQDAALPPGWHGFGQPYDASSNPFTSDGRDEAISSILGFVGDLGQGCNDLFRNVTGQPIEALGPIGAEYGSAFRALQGLRSGIGVARAGSFLNSSRIPVAVVKATKGEVALSSIGLGTRVSSAARYCRAALGNPWGSPAWKLNMSRARQMLFGGSPPGGIGNFK